MQLTFAPLFSGSDGNAIYVEMGGTRLLVDAGVSGTRVVKELEKAKAGEPGLNGILVTHEHVDHVLGVGILSRKLNVPIYATEGTWKGMERRIGKIASNNKRVIRPGEDFYIGPIDVTPFPIPHDAICPVGYTLCMGNLKAAIATDVGKLGGGWLEQAEGSDVVLLESNHDVEMLQAGPYPYELKRRILSTHGHLSNEDAGKAAVYLANHGVRSIILGHLSRENNFPELAYRTVAMALESEDIEIGSDVRLDVARRDCLTGVYCAQAEESLHAAL